MATIAVNDNTPRVQYTATAGQTEFSVPFEIFQASDLKVWQTASGETPDDNDDLLTVSTHYSVALISDGDEGATVTLVSAASAGDTITIERDLPIARTSNYQTAGDFKATTVNDEQNKQVMMMQQLERDITRALRVAKSDEINGDMVLPDKASRASKFLSFDANGDPVAAAGTSADLTPVSSFINTLLDDANAETARATLGAAALAAVNAFTALQKWAQGAAIASANDLALGEDGNYFHVTGTTTINGIETVTAGTLIVLYFEGALTLTHGGSPSAGYDDLDLPGAANLTTAAGDIAVFVAESGVWRCLSYVRGAEKPLVRATTAQMESASSTEAVVTPAVQNQHPAHPKAWCYFDGSAASPVVAAGSAVASITKNAAGDYTINLSITMSSANYGVDITCDAFGGSNMRAQGAVASRTTTSVRVLVGASDTGTLADAALTVTIKGDV